MTWFSGVQSRGRRVFIQCRGATASNGGTKGRALRWEQCIVTSRDSSVAGCIRQVCCGILVRVLLSATSVLSSNPKDGLESLVPSGHWPLPTHFLGLFVDLSFVATWHVYLYAQISSACAL